MSERAPYYVVNRRVDAITMAYRVRFPRELVDELQRRSMMARKHGRALFRYGSIQGEMKFSKRERVWLVVCPRYRIQFALGAPGAEGDEPGWTLELIWSAGALAVMSVGRVRKASHRIAAECGTVYGKRLRRIDLCADVAGWRIEAGEIDQFVRRPRAKREGNAFSDDDVTDLANRGDFDAKVPNERIVTHYRTSVTGFSFCPGSSLMARVYDKRAELQLKRADLREAEESRWRRNGWNGEDPITRVEYQIRGEALRDLGLRDPDRPTQDVMTGGKVTPAQTFNGLENVVDRVWRACLGWLRLARLPADDAERQVRAARRPTDERWKILAALVFERETEGAHVRVRRRGGASAEQTFGCVLSTLGQAGKLVEWRIYENDDRSLADQVHEHVGLLFARAADRVTRVFMRKWGHEALEHVIEVNNAAWAREFDVYALPPLVPGWELPVLAETG